MTHIKFMRCYLKVPKILMPQLSRLPKFLFTPFPSEVVPFGTDTAIPAGFAWSEHCCKSFRVWVFITFCDSVRISSMLLTRRPLSLNFNFGNRKKITGGEVRWVGRVVGWPSCSWAPKTATKWATREPDFFFLFTMQVPGVIAPLVWTFAPNVFPTVVSEYRNRIFVLVFNVEKKEII